MGQPTPPSPWSSEPPTQPAQPLPPYGQAPSPPGPAGWGPPPATPYGPPGQPYGSAPPPKRRGGGKTAGIIIAVVAVVCLCLDVAGGAVAYFSGSFDGDPEETVTDFLVAGQRGDCDRMLELVTESAWPPGEEITTEAQALAQCQEGMAAYGGGVPLTVDGVRLVSESGDTAIVEATITAEPPPFPDDLGIDVPTGPTTSTIDYVLVKDGRNWLIDEVEGGGFGWGGTTPPGEAPGLDDLPGGPGTPLPTASPGGEEVDLLQPEELYDSATLSYRLDLEDRVLEGELRRLEVYEHPDCVSAGLTDTARLALADCVHRVEVAYRGTQDGIGVSQQVLQFRGYESATAFADTFGDTYLGEVLRFEDPGGFSQGYAHTNTRLGGAGPFLVVTLLYSTSGDPGVVRQAEDDAHARHAESSSYFLWR